MSKTFAVDDYKNLLNQLHDFASDRMTFHRPPKLFFQDDSETSKVFIRTGFYDPTQEAIIVFVTDRHIKDILRSVCHEMVHHSQHLEGRLRTPSSEDYAQKDPYMRMLEKEAYTKGNMIMRDFENSKKLMKEWKDKINGGKADESVPQEFNQSELSVGIKIEAEHSSDERMAKEIAMDHLKEIPDYYSKLVDMELRNAYESLQNFPGQEQRFTKEINKLKLYQKELSLTKEGCHKKLMKENKQEPVFPRKKETEKENETNPFKKERWNPNKEYYEDLGKILTEKWIKKTK